MSLTSLDTKENLAKQELNLSQLQEGERAEILLLSPSCRGAMRRRLMDLGFVRGSVVQIDITSPMDNPTAYLVRGATIALRREQACHILVKKLPKQTQKI